MVQVSDEEVEGRCVGWDRKMGSLGLPSLVTRKVCCLGCWFCPFI